VGKSEWCTLLWWLAAITVAVRHLSSCWWLLQFTFQCTTRAQEHWAAVTPDFGLHKTWPSNRPDLSSVDYRLLRVIEECVYEKQQGTSNIVDELWLSTEWHFINRMIYYISQGRVETPIRRGGQLCCLSVANLLQLLCAKNYQHTMRFDKVIQWRFIIEQ